MDWKMIKQRRDAMVFDEAEDEKAARKFRENLWRGADVARRIAGLDANGKRLDARACIRGDMANGVLDDGDAVQATVLRDGERLRSSVGVKEVAQSPARADDGDEDTLRAANAKHLRNLWRAALKSDGGQ